MFVPMILLHLFFRRSPPFSLSPPSLSVFLPSYISPSLSRSLNGSSFSRSVSSCDFSRLARKIRRSACQLRTQSTTQRAHVHHATLSRHVLARLSIINNDISDKLRENFRWEIAAEFEETFYLCSHYGRRDSSARDKYLLEQSNQRNRVCLIDWATISSVSKSQNGAKWHYRLNVKTWFLKATFQKKRRWLFVAFHMKKATVITLTLRDHSGSKGPGL